MRGTALACAALALAGCERAPLEAGPPEVIARGGQVYAAQCAACHGANLEGQPEWRKRHVNGRLPAPPHDDSGHTWHHPYEVLFGITKFGLKPPYAPPGYESDMPAYAGVLADEDIHAVLVYIASRWSPEVKALRASMLEGAKG